jgi:hypothetical protein
MRIGRGNRSTRRKPAPVPLWPPQIPHYLTWARTRAAAVGKPAIKRLSYGTARRLSKYSFPPTRDFNLGVSESKAGL